MTYTAEQIEAYLDEARFLLREPVKSFIALDDSMRMLVAIVKQLRERNVALELKLMDDARSNLVENSRLNGELTRLRDENAHLHELVSTARKSFDAQDEETPQ